MNHTPDTATAGNGGTFDPRQAAALLDQTTQQARRKFQPSPPWLLATRAVLVLAALGAIWLSVRGQHPYRGPTAADIPVLVGFIVVNFAATVTVRRHATAGVTGRSRFSQGEIAVLVSGLCRHGRGHGGAGRRRAELRLVPDLGPGRPRPGLGGYRGDTGKLASIRLPASPSSSSASWARSPGRPGLGPSPPWACVSCSSAWPPPSPGSSAPDGTP